VCDEIVSTVSRTRFIIKNSIVSGGIIGLRIVHAVHKLWMGLMALSQSKPADGVQVGVLHARYPPKGRLAACGSTKTGRHVETFRAKNGSNVIKRTCSQKAKPERGIAYGLPKAARLCSEEDEIKSSVFWDRVGDLCKTRIEERNGRGGATPPRA